MIKTVEEFIEENKLKELFETSWGLNNIIFQCAQFNHKTTLYNKGLIDKDTYEIYVITLKNLLIEQYGDIKIEL